MFPRTPETSQNFWHSAGFLGWPFPVLKYKYFFWNKIIILKQVYQTALRNRYGFEITKMLIAVLKNKSVVSFTIIFGTLQFRILPAHCTCILSSIGDISALCSWLLLLLCVCVERSQHVSAGLGEQDVVRRTDDVWPAESAGVIEFHTRVQPADT